MQHFLLLWEETKEVVEDIIVDIDFSCLWLQVANELISDLNLSADEVFLGQGQL